MARGSAARAVTARGVEGESALRRRCAALPAPPPLRLDSRGFDLLAEIKRRSPAAGDLGTPRDDVGERAAAYARAGAAGISVLTEPDAFDGSLDDLEVASRATSAPVMRKDFLVDPYQLLEARAAGASGVLLILRLLDDARMGEMLDLADEVGLFVLLEAFDAEDLDRAKQLVRGTRDRRLPPRLVGLNCRDLATLRVDPARFASLRDRFPTASIRVAESGVDDAAGARAVAGRGYQVALVGSALMRAPDRWALVGAMLHAGRQEVGSCA